MNSVPDKALFKLIGRVIDFPYPQICKHLIAGALLELLETNGGTTQVLTSDELSILAKAIVQADDTTAASTLTTILEKIHD